MDNAVLEGYDASASEQSPEEQAVVQKVEHLFQAARKARRPKEGRWNENYEFYLGRQWTYRRPSYRHSEVVNLIFAAVEAIVPILTDNRPEFAFLPEDSEDRELAEALSKVADFDWSREGWDYILAEVIKSALISSGTSIGAMEFDPEQNSGLGRIIFRNVDALNIYPAPRAKDINDGTCPYFIEAEPIPVEEAKGMFPELAHMIKGSVGSGYPSKYERKDFDQTLNANSTRSNEAQDDLTSSYTQKDSKPVGESLLIKCYMQDDTMEEVKQACMDQYGNPTYTAEGVPLEEVVDTKKKYPNGRLTIVIDNLLAFDGDNPYKDGLYPYARFVDYFVPNEFWALSEVDNLKSPQRMLNRLLSFMMDTIVLMGNPIWVADIGAIDTDMVTNQPGLVVEKTPGSDVHREAGLGLPSNLFSVYELCRDAFDRIFGINELTQGARPQNVSSNVALETLQEAGQTRIRQKARNLEKFLKEIGTLYVSRVMQFYSTPRLITINQDAANVLGGEQFKFQIEESKENPGKYIATLTKREQQPDGRMMDGEKKKFETEGLFDVRTVVGSNLPYAKKSKANMAFQLFDRGVLPIRQFLKDLDYPNADKIADEAEQKAQQAAEAKAAQGG